MKLTINNKIFTGKYNENGRLLIPLDEGNDIIFFKKWQDKRKTAKCKLDYVENIEFYKITERGFLKNCFPIVNINEDFVELYYDLYEVIS
jgi:hypothetical protein